MSKELRRISWEIQYVNPYSEMWEDIDTCFSEEVAMERARFFALQRGEVRIVKHEETFTIIGTMKKKENHD